MTHMPKVLPSSRWESGKAQYFTGVDKRKRSNAFSLETSHFPERIFFSSFFRCFWLCLAEKNIRRIHCQLKSSNIVIIKILIWRQYRFYNTISIGNLAAAAGIRYYELPWNVWIPLVAPKDWGSLLWCLAEQVVEDHHLWVQQRYMLQLQLWHYGKLFSCTWVRLVQVNQNLVGAILPSCEMDTVSM